MNESSFRERAICAATLTLIVTLALGQGYVRYAYGGFTVPPATYASHQ